jgi:hypothetical protein
VAGRLVVSEKDVRSAVSAKKYMASVSATILRDTLRYFKDHNVGVYACCGCDKAWASRLFQRDVRTQAKVW